MAATRDIRLRLADRAVARLEEGDPQGEPLG